MIPIRHAGAVQSSAAAASYVDFDGATMDYDSGGGFAQITANRVGAFSAGLKLRTILAGVVLTAITFAAAGGATFAFVMSAPGITSTSGLTVSSGTSALQAVTGTTASFTSTGHFGSTLDAATVIVASGAASGVYYLGSDLTTYIQRADGAWGANRVGVNGHFIAAGDGVFDLGNSGGNRFRNLYLTGTGTFLGIIAAPGVTITSTTSAAQLVLDPTAGGAGDNAQLLIKRNGTIKWQVGNNVSLGGDVFEIYSTVAGGYALQINPTTRGATLAATLTAASDILAGVASTVSLRPGVVFCGGALTPSDSGNVANNGSLDIGDGTHNAVFVIIAADGSQTLANVQGGVHAVTLFGQVGAWSTASGTAASRNVFWNAGSGTYQIENKSGGALTFRVARLGGAIGSP